MAFAPKYNILFEDVAGVAWNVSFREDGFDGSVTTFTPGATPLTINYNCKEKYQSIIGSNADIQMVYESAIDDLYVEENQIIRVDITRATVDFWQGFLLPGQYHREFNKPKHYITLTATDELGKLKDIKFENTDGAYFYQQTEIVIIANILQKTGIQRWILDGINIFEDGMDAAAADSPLAQTYIFPEKYWDEIENVSTDCYTVLSDILRKYGAVLFQAAYIWYIVRPNAFCMDNLYYRLFTYEGVYASNDTYTTYNTIGDTLKYIHGDAEITKLEGLGRCEITANPGLRKNLLKNGGFNTQVYDGSNYPQYWTQSGTPNIKENGTNPDYLRCEGNESSSAPTKYITISNLLYKPTAIRINIRHKVVYSGSPTYAREHYGIFMDGSWLSVLGVWAGGTNPYVYDLIAESVSTMAAFEDLLIELPPVYEEGFEGPFGLQPTFVFRIYEFYNENAKETNYVDFDYIKITIEYDEIIQETKIYSYDNTSTIYKTRKETIALSDSWINDLTTTSYDDMWFHLADAVGRGNHTDLWYIKGHHPTVDTPVPIAELMAIQIVEGYNRSMDLFRGTLRTALVGIRSMTFRDSDFVDEYGYEKSYFPMGVAINAHRNEWSGEWVEVAPIYNDEGFGWASDTYTISTITDNEIDIQTDPVGGVDVAISDPYTCIEGEMIRIKVEVEDLGTSDLPNYAFDGNTGELEWGTNYLEFRATAGANTFDINHTDGERANCLVTFWFYSLKGL